MADTDDIVQRVAIEGGDESEAALQGIGKSGKEAFAELGEAADAAQEPMGAVAAAARRAGVSIEEMRAKIAKAKGETAGLATSAEAAAAGLASEAAAASGAAAATHAASAAFLKANTSGRNLASVLQIFGRITGVRDITQLARAINLLSRGLAVLAVPASLIFLDRLAASAAEASDKITGFALANKLSTQEFQDLAAAGTAVGVSNEAFSKSLEGITKEIKDGAKNQREFDDKIKQLNETMTAAREKAADLARGFHDIALSQTKLNEKKLDFFFKPSEAELQLRQLRDFREEQRQVDLQALKLNEQISAQEKIISDAAKAASQAAKDFEENKNSLQKLGIQFFDTAGKLKLAPAVLLEVADKLKALPEGLEKIKIRSDLVAAGLDKNLLPALEGGAAEFKRFQELGLAIRSPIKDADVETLRKFSVASSQLSSSLGALKDAFSAAIAPAFMDFIEVMTDIFIKIAPGVKEFGQTLTTVLKPVLDGIAAILSEVVIPAFRGLFSILDFVAGKINEAFGTGVTGMDLFVTAVLAIAAAFTTIPILIVAIIAVIGQLADAWKDQPLLIFAIVAALGLVALAFAPISVAIGLFLAALGFVIAKWDDFKNAGQNALNAVADFFQPAIDKAKELWGWLKKIFGAQQDVAAEAGAAAVAGFAGGGRVRGPGTTTSDSILARLSTGEWVHPARAVAHYGSAFMRAVQNLQFPVSALGGFARGGLVEAATQMIIPRFATGGPVPALANIAGRPVVLNIGGESFNLVSKEQDTADRLTRFAVKRRVASSGRKPSYYGG